MQQSRLNRFMETVTEKTMLLLILASILVVPRVAVATAAFGNLDDELYQLIQERKISAARWLALHKLEHDPNTHMRKSLSREFKESFDVAFSVDAQGFFERIRFALANNSGSRRIVAVRDEQDCTPAVSPRSQDPAEEWDSCCSMLPSDHDLSSTLSWGYDTSTIHSRCEIDNPCCNFFVGSPSHLRLPALYEPAIVVRLDFTSAEANSEQQSIFLEQDGYLRLFDVAVVLWPSGYLLAQCLANPDACGIQDLLDQSLRRHHFSTHSTSYAVELGTGIGLPSIALSIYLQKYRNIATDGNPSVIATDVQPQAIDLAMCNSWHNGATDLSFEILDFAESDSVQQVRNKYTTNLDGRHSGFGLVFGSSLQSLFENTSDPACQLWKALDILLDRDNPSALAILVHVRATPLVAPSDGSFVLVRSISGDRMKMQTRVGSPSDFEIYLFRRGSQASDLEL